MVDRHNRLPIAFILLAYVSANTIALGQSQAKPADQDEPVRLRTELVQVQVVVTDKRNTTHGRECAKTELFAQSREWVDRSGPAYPERSMAFPFLFFPSFPSNARKGIKTWRRTAWRYRSDLNHLAPAVGVI